MSQEQQTEVTDTYISPHMVDVVGLELRRATSFPISESDIRRWAIAVYHPEPAPRIFWDTAYAATTTHGGIVAPEEFNPFAWITQTEADAGRPSRASRGFVGPEAALGIPAPPTTKMIHGGLRVEHGVRMRPGDVITSVSTLAGYDERTGRLGRMLFTTSRDEWTNQRGETVKVTDLTTIRY